MKGWPNLRRFGSWGACLALVLQLTLPFAVAQSLRAHAADPAGLPCHAPAGPHAHSQQAQDRPDAGGSGAHSHSACPLCLLLAQAGNASPLPDGISLALPLLPAAAGHGAQPVAPDHDTPSPYNSRAPPGLG